MPLTRSFLLPLFLASACADDMLDMSGDGGDASQMKDCTLSTSMKTSTITTRFPIATLDAKSSPCTFSKLLMTLIRADGSLRS